MNQRIKFLFVTKDWSQGIEKNTLYLGQALARLTNYMEWQQPGDINDIVSKLPARPDFILLNDLRPTRCPEITGIDRLKIPLGIIMHDTNFAPETRKAFIWKNNIRHLFVHYREHFLELYPEFADRMIWFPHWVNTHVFMDYQLPKSYDYLIMGCTFEGTYPLRARMLEAMQNERGFMHHPHPGYDWNAYNESQFVVGRRYAKEINRAKLFLTDDSVYHHLFMKYFEVAACNTLLLAPHSRDAADQGFVPSVNFVDISDNDFLEKARYYADNYNTVGRQIARRGFEMVRQRHSTETRAAELVGHVTRILGGSAV